jgi:hypothetical protein
LRLLQRIRDEAHRFANGYHQLLMKKRIGESILDDCPGVSQNRKNLLLRKFGSVSRLRKASVEQIAGDGRHRPEARGRSAPVSPKALRFARDRADYAARKIAYMSFPIRARRRPLSLSFAVLAIYAARCAAICYTREKIDHLLGRSFFGELRACSGDAEPCAFARRGR